MFQVHIAPEKDPDEFSGRPYKYRFGAGKWMYLPVSSVVCSVVKQIYFVDVPTFWLAREPSQTTQEELNTLIIASQEGSSVKVTKMLNREVIIALNSDHEEEDKGMFVHCEYQQFFQDVHCYFSRNRCSGFILASLQPTVHSRALGSTQVLEETKGSFPCTRPLKKWVQICAIFYRPSILLRDAIPWVTYLNGIGKRGGYTEET